MQESVIKKIEAGSSLEENEQNRFALKEKRYWC